MESAFNKGYKDFFKNKDISDNPYIDGTLSAKEWEDGWQQGSFENEVDNG